MGRTCYEMYRRSPTGISPEYGIFNIQSENDDFTIPGDAPHFLLRPEAAEAIYYLHYYTGDPKHRRVRFGYSSIRDVRQTDAKASDSMRAFGSRRRSSTSTSLSRQGALSVWRSSCSTPRRTHCASGNKCD